MQQKLPQDENRQYPQRQPPGQDFGSNQRKPGLPWSSLIWLLFLVLLTVWLWNQFLPTGDAPVTVNYSTFRDQLLAGNVQRVTIAGEEIRGQYKEAVVRDSVEEGEPLEYQNFVTYLPAAIGDESLLSLLEAQDVVIEVEPADDFSFWALALNFLPFLLLIAFGYYFLTRMRRQGQGIFQMGQSRAKLYDEAESEERTTFDDVANLEGAKTELREIIEYLKDPQRLHQLGGTAPKGILLVGPPGTGKTLLARAVAGEARVPFFSITGSDFMEMFVGVGASRVRGLFENARKAAPCIIFIDELDSIGRRRGAGLGGGHDEREQTLNQLLSELDGFEPTENVVVMAATNRPDILDPALLRPGRFDRRVTVDLPTLSARRQILEIHARNKPLSDDVDLERLARGTPGFSGADLENVLNEAALMAAREHKEIIEWQDIEDARDRILMGLKREGLALTEEECQLIAYHEAGHAIAAAVLPHADPVHKVTIVPRGQAMGATQQLPEKEKYIYPREYLLDRMAVMMGGRAAEKLIFDTATSGAENDLKQATQLARKMVLDWGMSEKLGHVSLGGQQQEVFLGEQIGHQRQYSETTAREVDEEVKLVLEQAFSRALSTLRDYRLELDEIAKTLLSREEMSGEEVSAILGQKPEREKEARPV
ncbi:MAG TPA: ATP-dependent zinc metalloprotease FtsH [Anaerolineae bacterium]